MSDKKSKTPKKNRKKQGKVRWEQLENEYISSRISYKDLAKKHKITQRQVEKYGSEHSWVQKRRDFVGEVSANVKNALINDETNRQLTELEKIGEAAKKIIDVVTVAMQDDKQFFKRSFYSDSKDQVIEYETSKLDGAAVNQVLKALEKAADVYRDAYGIQSNEKKKDVTFTFTLPEGCEGFAD